ncbi:MAG: DNA repair protein RecO [Alkalispirochaetaceae bacterium]
MSRNSTEEVVILRVRPVGEIHASVQMLARDSGLLDAMAYGARSRKGSLRGSIVPFALGTCYLYTDPVKGSAKITELSIREYHPEIRENLKKFYVASLWAELVLYSYAAGSEGDALWSLLRGGLSLLAAEDERSTDATNLQFLWRFLELLGTRPELPAEPRGRYRYLPEEHRFAPREELSGEESREGGVTVQGGSLAYLAASGARKLEEALRITLSPNQGGELKRLLFRLVQESTERELKSIRSGEGIL